MGLHPQATVCLDTATFSGFEFCGAADTAHVTEVEAPPDPPSAVFRFSPNRSTACNLNFWKDDVRKFTDTTPSDTFRVLLKTEPDLVDGEASPGEHSVAWEASGLPSGIYFCGLSTPGGVFLRKMLLAR